MESTPTPHEEDVVISFEVTEEKSFNRCFQCQSFLVDCSGPNLLVAGPERVCEFLQMVRIFTKKTYQQVADETQMSINGVRRTLMGKNDNPSLYTLCALAKCLLGSAVGSKYPCAIPNIAPAAIASEKLVSAARELETIASDNARLQKALEEMHTSYSAKAAVARAEADQRVAESRADAEYWRQNSESWRRENERKGKLIDKYLDKILDE